MKKLVLLIAVALLGLGCSSPTAPAPEILPLCEGYVYSYEIGSEHGAPVKGAVVTAFCEDCYCSLDQGGPYETDDAGHYNLSCEEPRRHVGHKIRVEAHAPQTESTATVILESMPAPVFRQDLELEAP